MEEVKEEGGGKKGGGKSTKNALFSDTHTPQIRISSLITANRVFSACVSFI